MRSVVQIHLGPPPSFSNLSGAVAQLVERRLCKAEVAGSSPASSTRSDVHSLAPAIAVRFSKRAAIGGASHREEAGKTARGSLTTEDPELVVYLASKTDRAVKHDVLSSVNVVVKLLRAYGGCLGAGRR